ncbi:hypothetical protein BXY80_0836 [Ichthyenterobacterium magnum]|uniref:Uncharacterized protein n=1 Tax=Ichthyenterobacterium magnum TaxID=1230530 RepID=A0A420DX08_9FLAO|nr:hypothetical protein BXY80_0836 [Ichthyenterobacterium magnum]
MSRLNTLTSFRLAEIFKDYDFNIRKQMGFSSYNYMLFYN